MLLSKIINMNIKYILSGLAALTMLSACSDDFLEPEALSFYEPGATFTTESGLKAAMAVCDRHLRMIITNGDDTYPKWGTELMFSDMMLWGKTDEGTGIQDDMASKLTPTTITGEISYLWDEAWTGIKYANTILSNVDLVNIPQEQKDQYRAQAYFHRAIRYYNLVFEFGDLPLVTKIISKPKTDYKSCPKEEILEMLAHDLDFAVKHCPSQSEMDTYGSPNKEACRMLLAKVYLAIGKYKEAEKQCDELITNSGLQLMREPFGTFIQGNDQTWPIMRNVIWDLHRAENKIMATNKELIMGIVNCSTLKNSIVRMTWMRIFGPFWNGNLTCPDGVSGTPVNRYALSSSQYDAENDWVRVLGRGIATLRSTYYAQHSMWVVNGVEDKDDLRHNSKVGNWVNMEDIRYTNKDSKYYNQGLMLYAPEDVYDDSGKLKMAKGTLLCSDTIRTWHDSPLYKIYYQDHTQLANPNANDFQGVRQNSNDNGNMYLFRLAEAYLVRAEAKLYQGNSSGAASDLNELRSRAKCSQMYSGNITIDDIADERGRELWFEEWRNVELTRMSMCLANTGVPDRWGNTYGSDWDKQSGTDRNGGSYWYQRLMHCSLYNRGYTISSGNAKVLNYTMDKRNVFWPIPYSSAIEANPKGTLHQNYGYDGYNDGVEMWNTWEEAVADEENF